MYKINPADANTELYGIGKGLAQVVNPAITVNANERKLEEEERKRIAKEKAKLEREQQVQTSLSGLGKAAIFTRDQPLFAKKQNDIVDYVKKNITKINDGDTDALMGFQTMINGFTQEAEASKNAREQWEATGQKIVTTGAHKFRPETLQAHNEFSSPTNAGNYNYDASQINENINYTDRMVKELSPFAQRMAKDSPYKKIFTLDQAKELIATDLTDPSIFEQASYDFGKAKDKMGAADPIQYYQNKYAKDLVVADTKAGPQTAASDKTKRPAVSTVVTRKQDGTASATINFTDKPDNPYLTIDNPMRQGQTLELRPMEIIKNKDGKIFLKGSTKATGEGENRREGRIVTVDYNSVADVMNNTFGITNAEDLFKGNAPEHVTVKQYDLKDNKSGSDKLISTKVINGVKRNVYQRPDGSKYAK